ncbi:alpha/beta hydrolase-fold protein [Flammeovirga sp. EKP202]|uniref:alpha/beta hydrolase-fold protein n=1 Tax=Flammeovirga sp. EKP202 TaxID=2770592 RepID=UPI00165FDE65|nr:alpha/beta hydrolase-fold protein [Flammeovirga sp. EKP202]MBD0405403.1 esterase [Flammeovirga sp. EKP202]
MRKNKLLFLLSLCLCLPFLSLAQKYANVEIVNLHSKHLDQDRELFVYTPAGYTEEKYYNYNVVYVFDAQSREIFDYVHASLPFIKEAEGDRNIVVGITSPYFPDEDYGRNNDFLPVLEEKLDKARYGKYSGNAENFSAFFLEEVIPFINENYHTSEDRLVVGHSLSASFVLSYILPSEIDFRGYLAISPNLAYEKNQVANKLMAYDFDQKKHKVFLFLCNADEGNEYWQHWVKPREKTYAFFEKYTSPKLEVEVESYPFEDHFTVLGKGLSQGLSEYFTFYHKNKDSFISDKTYPVTITCKVPHKKDQVYIVGNQKALGNWNPDKVKLEVVNDSIRTISLEVTNPAIFKFTRGDWSNEGFLKDRSNANIMINPLKEKEYHFEIVNWADKMH